MALVDHGDDLWTWEAPLRYLGVAMGRRMAIVRLGDGSLLLHSPAPLTDELRAALDGIGEVRLVAAAGSLHGHAHMGDYRRSYPAARLLGTPELARKRSDLDFDRILAGSGAVDADGEVLATPFEGHRMLDELEFFHPASRTLITGDLCFNIGPDWPLHVRLFANGPRLRRRLGPTPLFRSSVKDAGAARASVDRILEWDFDRILPGHGDIVEAGGRDLVRAELLPRFTSAEAS